MKHLYLTLVSALLLSLCSQNLFAAGTNDTIIADLTNLVAKINAKIVAGKSSEANYADNIKEFGTLLAKHKDAKPEDLQQVFSVELQLYLQVLNDPKPALKLLKQIKHDYPDMQIGGNTDQLLKQVEAAVVKQQRWRSLAAGSKFPDFTTKDIAGKSLSLEDYKGKVVLIDFWATWCPPCRAEVPNVVATYKKYHGQGFDIIGVSLDQNRQKLLAFTKEHGMTWPQYFDGQRWQNKLAVKYAIQAIPATFLLDTNGVIIARDLRGEALEQAVAKALSKK